jgi:hypothetical protein
MDRTEKESERCEVRMGQWEMNAQKDSGLRTVDPRLPAGAIAGCATMLKMGGGEGGAMEVCITPATRSTNQT